MPQPSFAFLHCSVGQVGFSFLEFLASLLVGSLSPLFVRYLPVYLPGLADLIATSVSFYLSG